MLYNRELAKTPGKLHYLVIEKWGGIDARADYAQQARALRRYMDAIEYVEAAYRKGQVIIAHHLSGHGGTAVLLAVTSHEELGDYIKANPANARMAPADRTVIPMGEWDDGRETFGKLIENVENLAREEERYAAEGRVRPFEMGRTD